MLMTASNGLISVFRCSHFQWQLAVVYTEYFTYVTARSLMRYHVPGTDYVTTCVELRVSTRHNKCTHDDPQPYPIRYWSGGSRPASDRLSARCFSPGGVPPPRLNPAGVGGPTRPPSTVSRPSPMVTEKKNPTKTIRYPGGPPHTVTGAYPQGPMLVDNFVSSFRST